MLDTTLSIGLLARTEINGTETEDLESGQTLTHGSIYLQFHTCVDRPALPYSDQYSLRARLAYLKATHRAAFLFTRGTPFEAGDRPNLLALQQAPPFLSS